MRVRSQVRDAQRAIAASDVNYRHAANRLVRAIGGFSRRAVLRSPSMLRKSAAAAAIRVAGTPDFPAKHAPSMPHQPRANAHADLLGCA